MHLQKVSLDAHIQRSERQFGKQSKIALYQERARLYHEPVHGMGAQHCQTALCQAYRRLGRLVRVRCRGHEHPVVPRGWFAQFLLQHLGDIHFLPHPGAPWRRPKLPHRALSDIAKRTADPAKGTSHIWVQRMGKARGQEAAFLGCQGALDGYRYPSLHALHYLLYCLCLRAQNEQHIPGYWMTDLGVASIRVTLICSRKSMSETWGAM